MITPSILVVTAISIFSSPSSIIGTELPSLNHDETIDHETILAASIAGECRPLPSKSLYTLGGSAQAFQPSSPRKHQSVCDVNREKNRQSVWKLAWWPWSRSSHPTSAPTVEFSGRIYGCRKTPEVDTDKCCLVPIENIHGVTVEVWQARPDGTYSSIGETRQDGDCRATLFVPLSGQGEQYDDGALDFEFTTYHPGSTGSLGGLGPMGIDFPPYGPPSLHFLLSAPGYEISLGQVTLAQNFTGTDLRGQALFSGAGSAALEASPVQVTSMEWMHNDNTLVVDATFVLMEDNEDDTRDKYYLDTRMESEKRKALCRGSMWTAISSFFLEPISLCFPSLLDFFEL